MKTLDAIKKRRSIRYYDSNYVIPDNEINELINLTMLTATSYNIQHWKFVVVDNPRLRKEIRKVSFDQAQITDASKLILVCTDIKAWEKDMPRPDQTGL